MIHWCVPLCSLLRGSGEVPLRGAPAPQLRYPGLAAVLPGRGGGGQDRGRHDAPGAVPGDRLQLCTPEHRRSHRKSPRKNVQKCRLVALGLPWNRSRGEQVPRVQAELGARGQLRGRRAHRPLRRLLPLAGGTLLESVLLLSCGLLGSSSCRVPTGPSIEKEVT